VSARANGLPLRTTLASFDTPGMCEAVLISAGPPCPRGVSTGPVAVHDAQVRERVEQQRGHRRVRRAGLREFARVLWAGAQLIEKPERAGCLKDACSPQSIHETQQLRSRPPRIWPPGRA
jgi:hypothetical protein